MLREDTQTVTNEQGFPSISAVKNPPALQEPQETRVQCLSGRFPAAENGNPLQYSRLENPMDRGAWWATVHRVAKGWTGMSDSQAFQCTPDVLCACPQSEASMLTREQLGARTGKALASALNVTASARKLQNRGKDKQK